MRKTRPVDADGTASVELLDVHGGPQAGHKDLSPIRGPRDVLGTDHVTAVDLGLPGAVGVHDIELVSALGQLRRRPIARERDLLAVRGPGRVAVVPRIVGQASDPAAVGVHGVDLKMTGRSSPVAGEDDLAIASSGRGSMGCIRPERKQHGCENEKDVPRDPAVWRHQHLPLAAQTTPA